MSLPDYKIINLPKILDERGNLSFCESENQIPFDIKRIYYLYDVPNGITRGGHGHKELEQLIIAASGSFDVVLDDAKVKRIVTLNRPMFGLYIKPGIWRDLVNFSSGSVLLVLASIKYSENDYIRDYNDFLNMKKWK
ncbi:MAG: WxcM-like domain-containing protein [Rickettsiales bacterium]|nr:MAG: WxcM-like domain-containing protein [Rickettsiales bacterium]